MITGGVDTHLDVHVTAALSSIGGLLGTASFRTTPTGYRQLLAWLASFGPIGQVGVEGTSSYGTGLTRALQAAGVTVVEVDRPKRQNRRRVGKSDTLDAVAAARAVLAGEALGAPKSKNGNVEGVRVLTVVRTSSMKARTQTLNQIRALVSTAPADLREKLRGRTIGQTVQLCAAFRPGNDTDVHTVTKLALRVLARRVQALDAEVLELEQRRTELLTQVAPDMLAAFAVGPDTAAALLVWAGDNPERVRSGSAYARMTGVAPIPAGSGKTNGNHRGGDRQANSALRRIVQVRMATDPKTKAYVQRRTQKRQI